MLFTNVVGPGGGRQPTSASSTWSRGAVTTLIENACFARYVPTGHLIFGQKGAVHVAPFDADRREVTGPSVPIPEPIFVDSEFGVPHLAFSAGGTLAYIPGGGARGAGWCRWIWPGTERPLFGARRGFLYPRYSPDGERLAVAISEPGDTNIWVLDLATGAQTKLTLEGANQFPVWTPDGQRLSYFPFVGRTRRQHRMAAGRRQGHKRGARPGAAR